MPETLIFTTSNTEVGGSLAGDEVLVERSGYPSVVAFISITERRGGSASAFLTLGETEALIEQLQAFVDEAK